MKSCEYGPREYSQHFIFFTTREFPKKLECYVQLVWKDLPVTNTLAHRAIRKLGRKLSVVNMVPETVFTTLHFLYNL